MLYRYIFYTYNRCDILVCTYNCCHCYYYAHYLIFIDFGIQQIITLLLNQMVALHVVRVPIACSDSSKCHANANEMK